MPSSKVTREFLRLRAAVDRATPLVRRQVQQALEMLQKSLPLAQLEKAIAARDAFALHDIAAMLPRNLRPALGTLERAFFAGGQSALGSLRVLIRFDAANHFAADAARQSGARLVADVTAQTRAAIRSVVSRSFVEGITPQQTARLVKPTIGLTRQHALSVMKRYVDDIASGLSRDAALARAHSAAARLLEVRSMTIARTEIIRASTDGHIAGWREAQQRGLMSPRALKVWIVTPDDRLCRFCQAMDGQTALVSADFQVGTFGVRVQGPPLHPNCRCAVGVTFARTARAA